ncbi:hypothetical protein Mgra_00005779 [Meloidogyne graminicola]|uniref:Uncharacterized protein n=1 Tax=Meloidogyne graminicola TaxID=189291 RepID=A0A8S9ZN20_9BILA|nr:hypothetical protein Mgra_00005779 [Meloidogyne graminicola]
MFLICNVYVFNEDAEPVDELDKITRCCYNLKKKFWSSDIGTNECWWLFNYPPIVYNCETFIDRVKISPSRHSTKEVFDCVDLKAEVQNEAIECAYPHLPPKIRKLCSKSSNKQLNRITLHAKNRMNEQKETIKRINETLLLEGRIAEWFFLTYGATLGTVVGAGIGTALSPGGGTLIGGVIGGSAGTFIMKEALDYFKTTEHGYVSLNMFGNIITGGSSTNPFFTICHRFLSSNVGLEMSIFRQK